MTTTTRLTARLAVVVLLATLVVGAHRGPSAEAAPTEAALTGVRSLSVGRSHACVLLSSGQLRCWGENANGEIGLGFGSAQPITTPSAPLNDAGTGPLRNVVQVAVGENHTCAVLASGQARCWGDDDQRQLGNGPGGDATRPVPVLDGTGGGPLLGVQRITAGSHGACALLTSSEVRCWGLDDQGQLGDGSAGGVSELPTPVRNATGTANLSGVVALDGGLASFCALLASGQARCWGNNGAGGLGNGSDADSALPVPVSNAAGTGPLNGITQLSVGSFHACARLHSGQARCWGVGSSGVLGDGSDDDRFRPVAVRTGAGTVLKGVRMLAAGRFHTCAVLATGQARCWGSDDIAQLGDGTIAAPLARFSPSPVRSRSGSGRLRDVVGLSTSYETTCARRADRRVLCWGFGYFGLLGNGGSVASPLPVLVQA